MSTSIKRVLQRCALTHTLPYLKQGSTLSIRSKLQTDLRIRSQWRDDGQLSFTQYSHIFCDGSEIDKRSKSSAQILLSRNGDKMTSLGREDPHVSVHVLDENGIEQLALDEDSNHDFKSVTTLLPLPPPVSTKEEEKEQVEEGNCLTLDVPDKINIDCELTEGGSIFVESKIEGDVRLKTALGNISVNKLRGHKIDLEIESLEGREMKCEDISGKSSFIFVSDVLESQSLRLVVPRSVDRIRAKRIHANTMEITVGEDKNEESSASASSIFQKKSLFDEDDSGAICDISALYVTGDGNVDVHQSCPITDQDKQQRQAVRIKSHHGHVNVQVSSPKPNKNESVTGERSPTVDLGGCNGSCEVSVKTNKNSISENAKNDWISCHVHFDSITPDSVSLLNADEGNIHVTVDRKVESDVRILSPPPFSKIDTETLLLEDNDDGTMADEVSHMLREIENRAASEKGTVSSSSNRIRIETQAFTPRERVETNQLRHCEFVDGWIENTTSEPDSRFDRKIRGTSGGGKINIDGAQNQALHGFGIDKENSDRGAFARPLLAVSSPDKIVLETLSWLGNIARRYGLDDNREEDDLGRQATRRKGLGREIPANE